MPDLAGWLQAAGGGKLIRCTGCHRLIIYGQTCVCGTNSNPARRPGYQEATR